MPPKDADPFKCRIGASLERIGQDTPADRPLVRLPDRLEAITEQLMCNQECDAKD